MVASKTKIDSSDFAYEDDDEYVPLGMMAKRNAQLKTSKVDKTEQEKTHTPKSENVGRLEKEALEVETKKKAKLETPNSTPKVDKKCIKSKKVVQSEPMGANRVQSEPTRANRVQSEPMGAKGGPQEPSIGDVIGLDFLAKNEKEKGVLLYTYDELGEALGKTYDGAKKTVKRLVDQGLVARLTPKNTGSGGGAVLKVTEKGFSVWNESQLIAWAVAKSKKVVQSEPIGPILDDDDLNHHQETKDDPKVTSEAFTKIDLSAAHAAGIHLSHQLIAEHGGSIPVEKIELMLKYFVFEFKKKGKSLCENPVGYFRTALKNGSYRKPKGFDAKKEPNNIQNQPVLSEDEAAQHEAIYRQNENEWIEFKKTSDGIQHIKDHGDSQSSKLKWLTSRVKTL